MFYSSNQIRNHSTPSISGGKKSTSGRRPVIMAALPRIRWRDILCTSWLTTSLSSDPVCLASAAPRRLSWLMAWWCMPPSVSRAIGRKTIPCCLLLCPAFCDHTRCRELRLGVQWRRQGWSHCLLMAAVNYITAFKILFWRRWRHCV